MNTNKTSLKPKEYLGPELDLSKSPIDQVEGNLKVFMDNTNPPYRIYTDMSDEAAELVRNILDDAYEEHGLLWSRWGHNQWRIRIDE